MLGGPPEIDVTVSYLNGWYQPVEPRGATEHEAQGDLGREHRMVKNGTVGFNHPAPPDALQVWSTVTITATEIGGTARTWEHIERAQWNRPRASET